MATSYRRGWFTTPWCDLVDGEHDGYARLPDPVTHRRVIVFLKPDLWIIWDDLRGAQKHDLEMLMHLRPDCAVEEDRGGAGAVLTSPAGQQLWMGLVGSSGGVRFDVLTGDDPDRGAWFSPGYGTRTPSRALRAAAPLEGEATLVNWISAEPRLRPLVGTSRGALDVRLHRPDGREDRLRYRTDGRPLVDDDGVTFDGSLLFVRKSAGALPVVVANGFRALRIDRVLEATAPGPVETLVLSDDRCEVTIADEYSSGLVIIAARDGMRLTVNGRSHAMASAGLGRS